MKERAASAPREFRSTTPIGSDHPGFPVFREINFEEML